MNQRQQRAKTALAKLMELGLSQKDIALRIGANFTTMSHINNIERAPEFYVSDHMAENLERLVIQVRREMSEVVNADLPLRVVDTCASAGVVVTDDVRKDIRHAMASELSNSLIPESPAVDLPEGIAGAIAALTPNLYLIMLNPSKHSCMGDPSTDTNRTRLLIHELEHLIDRLRFTLPEAKRPYRPSSAY